MLRSAGGGEYFLTHPVSPQKTADAQTPSQALLQNSTSAAAAAIATGVTAS